MSACFLLPLLLAVQATPTPAGWPAYADAVVAADGSGQFRSLQDAIFAAPTARAGKPWIIYVRPGTYRERLYVQSEKRFVALVGEDALTTVVTYDLHANVPGPDGKPIGTFRTPTAQIDADDFTVENLTFENTAGPVGQALAIRVDGDRVAFRRCRFLGWQDTILVNRGRQYFEDCFVSGHVDFIFGGATAYFERCTILARGEGFLTAASTPQEQPHGLVFSRCTLRGETPEVRTYLGRPWRNYGSTVFLDTEMSEVVRPEGWDNWRIDREKTARYAEHGSTGPGARAARRVPWARTLSDAEAAALTPRAVLAGGDGWDPAAAGSIVPRRGSSRRRRTRPPAASRRRASRPASSTRRPGGTSLRLDACVPGGRGPFAGGAARPRRRLDRRRPDAGRAAAARAPDEGRRRVARACSTAWRRRCATRRPSRTCRPRSPGRGATRGGCASTRRGSRSWASPRAATSWSTRPRARPPPGRRRGSPPSSPSSRRSTWRPTPTGAGA